MNDGFIKLNRSKETEKLIKDDPNAFLLLTVIALRANRTNTPNDKGLSQGEALVGDYKNYGMSRQEYRGAILRLRSNHQNNHQNNHQISTRATTKGTIVKLTNSSIYDINQEAEQPTKPPDSNQQDNQTATTNKKLKKHKEVRERVKGFQPPTEKEVSEYAKSINFTNLNSNEFVNYYQARGWELRRGQKMKDWKAAVRYWKSLRQNRENEQNGKNEQYEVPEAYKAEAIEV